MCGRFTLYSPLQEIVERFNVAEWKVSFEPRYNIAPSQQVLAVVSDGEKNRMGYLKWGFIPRWSKEPSIGHNMINARAETLAEKPSFRHAYQKRRCLIIADGFYEWKKEQDRKVPMYIQLNNQKPFAFAGLWERWISSEGEDVTTCTIVTTKANEFMIPIHHRMPVILTREQESVWLDRKITDPHILNHLLQPIASEEMTAYPVSTLVNSPKNDHASLIEPVSQS